MTKWLATLTFFTLLGTTVVEPVQGGEVNVTGGGNVIDQGGGRRITGNPASPVTIRNWYFDLTLDANDWPHGPQFLDAAAISSINTLGGSTTPNSFYGLELVVERTRASYSLPGVRGSNAIRGAEITLRDQHDPWESPHDADRWTGLGVYSDGSRTLGVGIVIGGPAGFDRPLLILGRDGRVIFEITGEGTVYVRSRAGALVPINP